MGGVQIARALGPRLAVAGTTGAVLLGLVAPHAQAANPVRYAPPLVQPARLGSAATSPTVDASREGAVAAWQQSSEDQQFIGQGILPSPALTGVKAVTVGLGQSLAVLVDGTITGWGPQYQAPSTPVTSAVQVVASADGTSVALLADGSVVQWRPGAPVTTLLSGGLSIAARDTFGRTRDGRILLASAFAAVMTDGTVVAWSLSYAIQNQPPVMTGPATFELADVAAVSLSDDGNDLALHRNGTVSTFNRFTGLVNPANPPELQGIGEAIAVAAGNGHGLALRRNGTVTAWGDNSDGQRDVPAGLTHVVAIAAGPVHSLALKSDGTVVGWGRGYDRPREFPQGLRGVTAIAAGEFTNLAITTMAAPSRPESLTVRTVGAAVEARWLPPSYLGTGGVTGYRVVVNPGAVSVELPATATTLVVGRTSSEFRITVTVEALSGSAPSAAVRAHWRLNDIAVFRPATNTWYRRGAEPVRFGRLGDIPVPGDYDGDGTTDIAVFRPATGEWHVSGLPTIVLGRRGDVPVPADLDIDGRTDPAVFRPADGTWHSAAFPTKPSRFQPLEPFGRLGDIPFFVTTPCGELCVENPQYRFRWPNVTRGIFRPGNGTVWPGGRRFGTAGDVPADADYTGDGRSEFALYRPGNNVWYRQGGPSIRYGAPGDLPVPGDYDVDGSAEIATFRPAGGTWHVPGRRAIRLGRRGDIPLAPKRWLSPSTW